MRVTRGCSFIFRLMLVESAGINGDVDKLAKLAQGVHVHVDEATSWHAYNWYVHTDVY